MASGELNKEEKKRVKEKNTERERQKGAQIPTKKWKEKSSNSHKDSADKNNPLYTLSGRMQLRQCGAISSVPSGKDSHFQKNIKVKKTKQLTPTSAKTK